ncbi:hypothetical protein L7F22_031063, partial [Adiantum nelumboides]|nr:hypothetical protein [Adiantum nelumboides]
QERRVGRVYYTRSHARSGNPEIDPFNYDAALEEEEEFHDNEEAQLLNQGAEGSMRDYGRLVKEVEALAITRAKAKGPINWREQIDVRDKVHEKVQKEQVQYAKEENEELEIAKKQQKLDKVGLLPIKEDKDWFEDLKLKGLQEDMVDIQLEEPTEQGQVLKEDAEKMQQVDQQDEVLEAVEAVHVRIVVPESVAEEQGIAKLDVEAQNEAEQI